jgi:hypothetical protein
MNKNVSLAAAAVAALLVAGSVLALGTDPEVQTTGSRTPAPAAASSAATAAKPMVSAAVGKDLQAAQKALTEKRYDDAIVSLDKVKANPKKNDYDEYLMQEFYFSAYAGLKNYENAAGPLEASMASKFMPPDELKQRQVQAATVEYQLKNYDKALDFGNQAIQNGANTPQMQTVVSQAYYLKGDYKNTDSFVRGVVDAQVKAGETPTVEMLELGLSATEKMKDEPGEIHWLELFVSYHPSAEYWENLLDSMYHYKLTDRQALQLYRLSADVGTLKTGANFAEMAQLELDAGSPGEAVTTLNNAFAANAFTDPAEKNRSQHLLETAKKQAAADQPTLAKSEAEAASAATGDRLIGAGIGYFGYGQYPQAIKDISAGLAKGTAKDSSDARLLLGIAQLKSGDKDAAVTTFKSVQGDQVYQRLAALWILRTKSS